VSGAATAGLAGLHVLADDDPRWRWDPLEQAQAACSGGASVVQLRAKRSTDARALELARAIRSATARAGLLFVVNDRFDLALACGADGVHLGQDDLPPQRLGIEARRRLLIGRSTHTLEQARHARLEPVDYVAFGPVFGTASKHSPYAARGLEALRAVAREVAPHPLIAIGGIEPGSAAALRGAGAAGIAVISAVAASDDPVRAVRELAQRFAGAVGSAA
jgi:thiamine-phosphate pyrophosphorylase